MERFWLAVVKVSIIAFALAFVSAGCDDDDEDSGPPADVSGVWQGPITVEGRPGTVTFSIEQEGTSITGSWVVDWEPPRGMNFGTFSGTYQNGVATLSVGGQRATITFSGNTATGSVGTVATFTLQKVS